MSGVKRSSQLDPRLTRRSNSRPPSSSFASDFVHAVGGDLIVQVEDSPFPERIDHVWISLRAGGPGRVLAVVSTFSNRNLDASFDPRVRVGLVKDDWTVLPPRGVTSCAGFDYASIESEHNVFYEHFERTALEQLLIGYTQTADLLEVWGTPYHDRRRPGLHQIHSRRKSCAVPEDIHQRDGALRFYFAADRTSVMVLLKFCGQP